MILYDIYHIKWHYISIFNVIIVDLIPNFRINSFQKLNLEYYYIIIVSILLKITDK